LVLRLKDALGVTSLVVTHDMSSARKVGDRVVMLYGGHFIADAPPSELEDVDNEMVARFVEGRASEEELAELEATHLGHPDRSRQSNE
jgi:phospholipid/cholesterol/gamma-HCH transport system ATP-binding protein